jgi:penicillin amidase
VAGSRTKDGRAIVANDMHLMLTAPGIWYRVRLEWPQHELEGLSLPGVPLIIQGSNGYVAWAFTNLTADLSDLIVVAAFLDEFN